MTFAQEVHAAWRDGMLNQGRTVTPERMTWDTLSDEDKELDKYIGDRLSELLVEAFWARAAAARNAWLAHVTSQTNVKG